MTEDQSTQAIGHLEAMYGRSYPSGSIAMLTDGLKDLPVLAMVKAVEKMTEEFNVLPTPVIVLKIAREQATAIREQAAEKEKRENQQAQTNVLDPRKQTTEIGKETCMLIRAKLADKIDDQTYLEGLRHLHKKYPHGGFAAAGLAVKAQIEAHAREGR